MKQRRPDPSEHAPYFSRYIDLVPETDILAALESQIAATTKTLRGVGESRSTYRYAPDKWTIKDVAGHLGDSERVFGYRAMCIARGDTVSLPSFDEKLYAEHSDFDRWTLEQLVEQLAALRRSHVLMLRNLADEAWDRRGTASDNPATARTLAYTMVGHERHHLRVLKEKYGVKAES